MTPKMRKFRLFSQKINFLKYTGAYSGQNYNILKLGWCFELTWTLQITKSVLCEAFLSIVKTCDFRLLEVWWINDWIIFLIIVHWLLILKRRVRNVLEDSHTFEKHESKFLVWQLKLEWLISRKSKVMLILAFLKCVSSISIGITKADSQKWVSLFWRICVTFGFPEGYC